jgi:hypothetical protein
MPQGLHVNSIKKHSITRHMLITTPMLSYMFILMPAAPAKQKHSACLITHPAKQNKSSAHSCNKDLHKQACSMNGD